ncbi:hypothetical protein, partial [Klebsiella pneumoniae]|uniref:hypothetical protein n=1 Tax=Klebsiella pneumoniae TaxID=573 RepID=UPI00312D13CE
LGCQKACVLPENPASYRVVRTKSYLFNKAVQTLCVGELVVFCEGLCSADFTVIQSHMRVSSFIELNDPQFDPKFSEYIEINRNVSGKIFNLTY